MHASVHFWGLVTKTVFLTTPTNQIVFYIPFRNQGMLLNNLQLVSIGIKKCTLAYIFGALKIVFLTTPTNQIVFHIPFRNQGMLLNNLQLVSIGIKKVHASVHFDHTCIGHSGHTRPLRKERRPVRTSTRYTHLCCMRENWYHFHVC